MNASAKKSRARQPSTSITVHLHLRVRSPADFVASLVLSAAEAFTWLVNRNPATAKEFGINATRGNYELPDKPTVFQLAYTDGITDDDALEALTNFFRATPAAVTRLIKYADQAKIGDPTHSHNDDDILDAESFFMYGYVGEDSAFDYLWDRPTLEAKRAHLRAFFTEVEGLAQPVLSQLMQRYREENASEKEKERLDHERKLKELRDKAARIGYSLTPIPVKQKK